MFLLPSESIFDEVRVTNKREQYKTKNDYLFILPSESIFVLYFRCSKI
jgi:hypothetical protein